MDETLRLIDEVGRWHARDVRYVEGTWEQLYNLLPVFKMEAYRLEPDGPVNPYMQSVIRLPLTLLERPIPVGVVSNTYRLAQHGDVAEKCVEGVREAGFKSADLRYQVGLTELGEWMNFRIYFPETFDHVPADRNRVGLRLECFNSVDGSSRLVLMLGWLRFICSNGMVIGETKAELKAIHNQQMDLDMIPWIVHEGLSLVQEDRKRLSNWESSPVSQSQLTQWADKIIPRVWGKKAACRAFHICTSGFDVEYNDPFAIGEPTTKAVTRTVRVPGAPDAAKNLYDVSQALSWIATSRQDSDERVDWQAQIPELVQRLQELDTIQGKLELG
jgi:hypothetical protein